jgi:hypothetical protein
LSIQAYAVCVRLARVNSGVRLKERGYTKMRDTQYATEKATSKVSYGEDEARMEKIFVKEQEQEEIRFSWWKNGNIVPRPLDLPESDLLQLIENGFGNVLSYEFLADLRSRIDAFLTKKLLRGINKP